MADEPIVPTPTSSPGRLVLNALLQLALGFLQSWFLRTLMTVVITIVLCLFALKYALSVLPGLPHLPEPPRLLPKPRRAEDAIGKILFGNSGCTATIIGPVFSNDEKIDILTAAHCVKVGAVGKMQLKDGRLLKVTCVSRDPASDAAWLSADNPGGEVPYLLLADANPQAGEIVWHQGYGIDRPANRESGIFKGTNQSGLQCQFRLSVSPGDSGGGIILDSAGKVISPVCCTSKLGGMGDVFGACPASVAKLRPHSTVSFEEPPLSWPVLPVPEGDFPAATGRVIGDK